MAFVASEKTKTLTIKLVKSLIGTKQNQSLTAESLGLRRIGDVTKQPNNAQTVGKINTIIHLVEVTEA